MLTASGAVTAIAVQVGPVFLLLSTTSLAVQYLYTRLSSGAKTHWLYASSNVGSLAAVVGYPIMIEPFLDVRRQLDLWSQLATLPLLVTGITAVTLALSNRHSSRAMAATRPPALADLLLWFAGGAGPVGLSLACTSYLAVDLGSNPIVWLGPFTAYLLTLILAFSEIGAPVTRVVSQAAPCAIGVLISGLLGKWPTTMVAYLAHLGAVTILLASWQLWFAQRRPGIGQIQWFYGSAAAGGLVASAMMGLVIPTALDPTNFGDPSRWLSRFVFGSMAPEYVGLIMLSAIPVITRPRPDAVRSRQWREGVEGILLGVILAITSGPVVAAISTGAGSDVRLWGGLVAILVVAVMLKSPVHLAGAVGSLVLFGAMGAIRAEVQLVEHRRSVFGQFKVIDVGTDRILMHGSTTHGRQPLLCVDGKSDAHCGRASGYYHDVGPIGSAVALAQRERTAFNLGVIGLGAGTMASYCSAGGVTTFYEIDPQIIGVAESRFGYLRNGRDRCGRVDVVQGDARLSLLHERDSYYDLLVADAFASDSVPAHLVTVEAIVEFVRTIRDSGILAFHTSNRYFDLEAVVLRGGRQAGLNALAVRDNGTAASDQDRRAATSWVFLAKREDVIQTLRDRLAVMPGHRIRTEATQDHLQPWTDQRHSLLSAFRWPTWSTRSWPLAHADVGSVGAR